MRRRRGEEEESAILLTQTELKPSELLAMADGRRNERQMEKSLPTCLSSSRSVHVCACVCGRGRIPPGLMKNVIEFEKRRS